MNQLLICCLLVILLRKIYCSEDEFRLLKDLRENYDPVERPVQNHSEPVIVQLKILLQQIVDVDEKNQVLTLVLWFQTYGTWTYSRSYVDLVLDETDLSPNQSMDMTYYMKNGEWTLISKLD
uniref:Neurotransmitter-gated ion-channel ligand-binding domain-containing protein n=1 Tax=Acrobeloides nanus TaxID=290746 RepID=A0A914CWC8_9BILA